MIKVNDNLYVNRINSLELKYYSYTIPGFICLGMRPIEPLEVDYWCVLLNNKLQIYQNADKSQCEKFLDNFIKENK